MGVALQHGLVAAHPGVVVDVARLGQAHRGVHQQVGLHRPGRPQGELDVGAVHGVAGLEGHHPLPAELVEPGPQLGRGQAQGLVVVVHRGAQHLELAGHVHRVGPLQHVGHPRVGLVRAAVHPLGLMGQVGPVQLGHPQGGQHDPLGVPQGQARPRAQLGRFFLGDVQHHRHRPQGAVGQAHAVAHGLVVFFAEETPQGGETAVGEQLEVTGLAGGQVPRGPVAGLLL